CHRLGVQGVPHTAFHIPCSTYHVPHTEHVEAYPQLSVCFQVEELVSCGAFRCPRCSRAVAVTTSFYGRAPALRKKRSCVIVCERVCCKLAAAKLSLNTIPIEKKITFFCLSSTST
ncbi:unnamed protein product, partial [Ectocarpus sp. 8 AP-2014]